MPQNILIVTFKMVSCFEKKWNFIKITMKLVPKHPNDYKAALFQVMAWCQTADKQLPILVLTMVYDAIWHYYRKTSYISGTLVGN